MQMISLVGAEHTETREGAEGNCKMLRTTGSEKLSTQPIFFGDTIDK